MDFDLTDDQRLLKDSVEKLLDNHYADFEKRKSYAKSEHGFDPAVWKDFADAGILGLPFSEDQGGFAGGGVETMIVMEAIGNALALEPYLMSTILCGEIIRHSSATLADRLLPEVAAGTKILALAQIERGARYDLNDVSLAARVDGDGYIIEGEKSLVAGGGAADAFIVSTRTLGQRRDTHGITLFLIDANAPGISRRTYPTQDSTQAAEISFAQVRVSPDDIIGELHEGYALLTRATDVAIAALCAEAVGAMTALTKLTVEYLKTRKQFGVTIGSFQALQHRAVDMQVMLEQARSMAIYAALMAGENDATTRHQAIAAAKIQIGRSAKFIGQQATQLHGGIGVTMEYKGGHYFKRLTMIEQQFGDADYHLRNLAQAGAKIAA